MYSWMWSKLPGNTWIKAATSTVLVLGVVALLWFVVFPAAEPLLPFDDVNLENGGDSGGDGDGNNSTPTHNEDDYEVPYDTEEVPG